VSINADLKTGDLVVQQQSILKKACLSTSGKSKWKLTEHVEKQCHLTEIVFSTSVRSKHLLVRDIETHFQFSVLVMPLKSCNKAI
jgi:hypothetical protein